MAIKKCVCENAYQDAKYGKGKRVANPMGLGTNKDYRCTSCGQRIISEQQTKK